MQENIRKTLDFYAMKPGSPIIMKEFGFFGFENWVNQGYVKDMEELERLCGFEEMAVYTVGGLGGCEAALCPFFEEEVLEARGDHELVRDKVGRHVLFFRNRRNGFMPEYVDHPVKDINTWERDIKWRMDKTSPSRAQYVREKAASAAVLSSQGWVIRQYLVGGYMYLRSLMGPEQLLYKFYDDPKLIHECMKAWLELSDHMTALLQRFVDVDELEFDEDICYKKGSLISPDMFKEFLAPYYQQYIEGVKKRQKDKGRKLFVQIATDGYVEDVIPLYRALGMNYMSPFEVVAGNDILSVAEMYPDLLMSGGMDKMVMAQGKDAIDRMVDRILPAMRERGGFIPTCDHGVPEEVSFENYLHFRKRLLEYA